MSVELREPATAELDALVALSQALARHDGLPFDAAAVRQAAAGLLADATLGAIRFVIAEGAVAGYFVVTFGWSLEYHGRDAFLDEIYLEPKFRGRGIGRRALDAAAEICRGAGVRALHLEVQRGNRDAQRLYRAAGFEDQERMLLTRRLEPADPGPRVLHRGGCHCGRVRFEVEAPARPRVGRCNCSRCSRTGFLHLIVPRSCFRLLQGEDELVIYTFNTRVAQHRFCRVCGIQSFYVPRSNPDGIDVDIRCLDPGTLEGFALEPFDGVNWEANAPALAHRSREESR